MGGMRFGFGADITAEFGTIIPGPPPPFSAYLRFNDPVNSFYVAVFYSI